MVLPGADTRSIYINSLSPIEQQFVVNAIRFETSQLKSTVVKTNVLIQLNRVSHKLAERVAVAISITTPATDPTYYHNNKTISVRPGGAPLLKLDSLSVGYLTSASAMDKAADLKKAFGDAKVGLTIITEHLGNGIDQTYSATAAFQFDAIIVDARAQDLFAPTGSLANSGNATTGNSTTKARSTLYPPRRPLEIFQTRYRFRKPTAVLGSSATTFDAAGIKAGTPSVYAFNTTSDASAVVKQISKGLLTFKFLDRYPLDSQ
ncbi:hypothetical protein HRS9139_04062 [Pyrenophora teres f. teres]|uniref:catalase n=1 Tax=Pyrenophora teres f. teres TaxID=97479 RepID=A0A6S6V6P8_9PLEO|nr:hypothetical protein HRS9139_04062 [Pyrenophora teres f. teres]KAE8862889.1 hypothetical protein PTNB29_05451 [Pyrenophora teres f. teres]CAE6998980.1 Catalase [Pyrenophora teres f. teres]